MSNNNQQSPIADSPHPLIGQNRQIIIRLNTVIWWLSREWEWVANGLIALVLGLSVLAPALMAAGLPDAGLAVYGLFAPHDHQLPHRAYFLFSPAGGVQSYSLPTVMAAGANPLNLRAFVGNADLGYKMALNQRMAAIFLGLLIGGIVWSSTYFQPKIRYVELAMLTLPLALDALGHAAVERFAPAWLQEANLWAVLSTMGKLPPALYLDTTIGSINWMVRTFSGLLFGLVTVWYLFAYLDRRFYAVLRELEPKLRKIGAIK